MNRPEWNETCSQAPCNREKFDPPAPTPLERLEAWVDADPGYRLAAPRYCEHGWSVCLTIEEPYQVIWPDESPTLDEAILAALAQAEESQNG